MRGRVCNGATNVRLTSNAFTVLFKLINKFQPTQNLSDIIHKFKKIKWLNKSSILSINLEFINR